MNSKIYFLLFFAALNLACSADVHADIKNPVRTIRSVSLLSVKTKIKKVTTARIVFVDYSLIKKDFPQLTQKTDAEIDAWLLSQTAFIAETQAQQNIVNTQILVEDGQHIAFRPPDYKRALVFEVDGGLIDG